MAEHFIDGVPEVRAGSVAGVFFPEKITESVPMRALINVHDCPFRLYLPHEASPKNIVGLLAAALTKKESIALRPGCLMARIVGCVSEAMSPELIDDEPERRDFDHQYTIGRHGVGIKTFQIEVHCSSPGHVMLCSGGLAALADWSSKNHLDKYMAKVVQFCYRSGSKPGATRTVRVDKVGYGKSEFIEGVDLATADLSEGYRRYNCKDIKGAISILN